MWPSCRTPEHYGKARKKFQIPEHVFLTKRLYFLILKAWNKNIFIIMKLAILATKSSTPKHFYPGCNIREVWDRYIWSKPCGEGEYLRTQKCLNQKKRVLYLGHCGLSDYLPSSNTVMITCISNFLANIKLMYRKQPQKILCFWNLFKSSCLCIAFCLFLYSVR